MTVQLADPVLVAPGIYQLRLPVPAPMNLINTYLLTSAEGVALVDCGTGLPETWDTLVGLLGRLGCRFADIRTILITHFHSDHYGQVGRIARESGARVLMHAETDRRARDSAGDGAVRREGEWIANLARAGAPAADLDEFLRLRRNARARYDFVDAGGFLADGAAVKWGEYTWEVIETPGHAPGHICFYERAHRILISGDHVLPHITPHVGITPLTALNPVRDYLSSLQKLEGLDPAIVLPGHGRTFGQLPARLDEIRQHHGVRIGEFQRALAGGAETVYDVSRIHFGTLSTMSNRNLAATETLAHLEFMVAEHLADRTTVDGVLHYRLPSPAAR